jgi:hypothetical protein
MDPTHVLELGAQELGLLLGPAGFQFAATGSGSSSGGPFASGEFRRGDRRLELHVRFSLGMVTYHVAESLLTHEELVRAAKGLLAISGDPEYPGFSDDPREAFPRLRRDIERFGQCFVAGTVEEFQALRHWAQTHPKATGFAALGR